MSVQGYKELCVELERIVTKCSNGAWLNQACEFVEEEAKKRVPVHMGTLQGSIEHTVTGRGRETLEGIIGTNAPHSIFVEFGTGPKGASNHSGISPNAAPVYLGSPWYVHESQLDPVAIAKYHWPKVIGKDGAVFYRMTGQAAQPFLYPALAQNIDTVIDIAERGIDDALKK